MRRAVGLGLVVLLVAACTTAEGFPTVAASIPPTQEPFEQPVPRRLSDEEIRALLTLRGDGIGEFRFGDPAASVVTSLTQTFGHPDEDIGLSCGTGVDRHVRWAELGLGFEGGELASWTVGSEYPPSPIPPLRLATTHGVELGQLRAHVARLEQARRTFRSGGTAEYVLAEPGGDVRVFAAGRPSVVVGMTAGTPCS